MRLHREQLRSRLDGAVPAQSQQSGSRLRRWKTPTPIAPLRSARTARAVVTSTSFEPSADNASSTLATMRRPLRSSAGSRSTCPPEVLWRERHQRDAAVSSTSRKRAKRPGIWNSRMMRGPCGGGVDDNLRRSRWRAAHGSPAALADSFSHSRQAGVQQRLQLVAGEQAALAEQREDVAAFACEGNL